MKATLEQRLARHRQALLEAVEGAKAIVNEFNAHGTTTEQTFARVSLKQARGLLSSFEAVIPEDMLKRIKDINND